ncbi:MAG TPA: phosphoenolpyruvate carboxylase, partial [Crenalkalicoccus sp.]|nr:phosphoenolpyruvate carboxylase [Crenalkalicoccus sp.]
MPDPAAAILEELSGELRDARAAAARDPFGDPVLLVALSVSRRLDDGQLDLPALAEIVQSLADDAAADRAQRIARYLGLDGTAPEMTAIAARMLRPDPADSPIPFAQFRALVETPHFAAVFTAHPTFSLPPESAAALAAAAEGAPLPRGLPHRPQSPTLDAEFNQAVAAIARGRDALDDFAGALLDAARAVWPDRWARLVPHPILLTSWVGYDTDGRTDIGWWDTLRYRLISKRMQFDRVMRDLPEIGACREIRALAEGALAAVNRQL